MGKRKYFIAVSLIILIAGLLSAVVRQAAPGGTEAFNLGVDFQGGTVATAKFKLDSKPTEDQIRNALQAIGINDAIIQASIDKKDEVLIKIPLLHEDADGIAEESTADAATAAAETAAGGDRIREALNTFGKEAAGAGTLDTVPDSVYKIVGTEYVGPVAGKQLRNQAVAATLLGMVGILLFIAFRYDWTYAAGAVIAVFHDVLITLAFFSVFQWEISLTVIAALLTLVGFSVNDSIVIFDRIRENLSLHRDESLYKLTNDAINQTMSRTIITGGLVFLSVLALVFFGGEVLFGFSVALFVGVITGTYSTIAIASPIAIWWQKKLGAAKMAAPTVAKTETLASASRRSVVRRSS